MKNTILTLHIFRGKATYDENGVATSENHPMKLEHNTSQYQQFLKGAANTGITKIKVLKATDGVNEIEIDPAIKAEIEGCVNGQPIRLTPEQKELQELRDMVNALKEGKTEKKAEAPAPGNDSELEAAREKYFEVFGKKPHHLKKLDVLLAEIAEKENA